MVPVTGNFQAETALNPLAQEALLAAFESGWADPKKIGQHPNRAALLRNNALESISNRLGVTPDQIEVTGEVGLGYFLSLAGLLIPEKTLHFGAGDRSGVIATVRSHQGKISEIPLRSDGRIDFTKTAISQNSVLAFQLANGETGVINSLPTDLPDDLLVAVDATASGARVPLPANWASAVFGSRTWGGPAGLALVAIGKSAHWKNPLPHISSARRTYGTYSLPLLLASAVALENFQPDDLRIRGLNKQIRTAVKSAIPDANIAGDLDLAMPHLISMVFPKTNGEEILRALASKGFAVDSGSACTAMNLQPSHVLAAMGHPTDGNIRIAIHSESNDGEVSALITALQDVVRSQQQR
ncbi:MAG: aminotransferase class V-fold PLP-dependent enzyme [Actinobacteria bacterium]|nr:aminotransferase class V-fold PLP-dependent enzyme [Actinomycetota bacterium]